jgi:hypothetical protein
MRLSTVPAIPMFRWLLAIFLAVFIVGLFMPRLARTLHLGRLPGDFAFRFRGRDYRFPLATTIIFSLLLTLFTRYLQHR